MWKINYDNVLNIHCLMLHILFAMWALLQWTLTHFCYTHLLVLYRSRLVHYHSRCLNMTHFCYLYDLTLYGIGIYHDPFLLSLNSLSGTWHIPLLYFLRHIYRHFMLAVSALIVIVMLHIYKAVTLWQLILYNSFALSLYTHYWMVVYRLCIIARSIRILRLTCVTFYLHYSLLSLHCFFLSQKVTVWFITHVLKRCCFLLRSVTIFLYM